MAVHIFCDICDKELADGEDRVVATVGIYSVSGEAVEASALPPGTMASTGMVPVNAEQVVAHVACWEGKFSAPA